MASERSMRREILSYGLISLKEEVIDYVVNSHDTSFILFDASAVMDKSNEDDEHPRVEKSQLKEQRLLKRRSGE